MSADREPEAATSAQWSVVLAAGLVLFMATIDMNIVAVALPVLEQRFAVDTATTEWVVLAYLLPLLAFALPCGRWLDQVGARPAMMLAVTGFVLASVAAGMAPTIAWLVGARAVQGAFGAMVLPLVPALATTAVPPHLRGRAMSVVATVGGVGAAAGPALGGLLVDSLGWAWIFYVNVPVSLVVLAVAARQLPAGRPLVLPGRRLLVEAMLLGSAAIAVLLALSRMASDGLAWAALALLAVPPLAGWHRTTASRPVRALLRTPGVCGPHLGLVAFAATVGAVLFVTPFYLLGTREFAASTTGMTMLALPLAMVVTGPLAGVLTDRWSARATAATGMAILTMGVVATAPLPATWGQLDLAWRLGVLGAGAGLFNTANLTIAMSHAPADLRATVGATTNLARQLGFATGPAMATTIWAVAGYAPSGLRVTFLAAAVVSLAGLVAAVAASGGGPRRLTLFARPRTRSQP